jgi:hypothetical protein
MCFKPNDFTCSIVLTFVFETWTDSFCIVPLFFAPASPFAASDCSTVVYFRRIIIIFFYEKISDFEWLTSRPWSLRGTCLCCSKSALESPGFAAAANEAVRTTALSRLLAFRPAFPETLRFDFED